MNLIARTTVAYLESRAGEQMGKLIARLGVEVLHAPALAEEPDVDPAQLRGWLAQWRGLASPLVIFQTGVGVDVLSANLQEMGQFEAFRELLERSLVAVRGPKPAAALRKRQVRIDYAAQSPFTTQTLLEALDALSLSDRFVFVQRHGGGNPELLEALRDRGAQVTEITAYRWGLPKDTTGLDSLLAALRAGTVSTLLVTSASQILNLMHHAHGKGMRADIVRALMGVDVLSIGPVTSEAVRQWGVPVAGEATPPKLGPMMTMLEENLRTRGLLA